MFSPNTVLCNHNPAPPLAFPASFAFRSTHRGRGEGMQPLWYLELRSVLRGTQQTCCWDMLNFSKWVLQNIHSLRTRLNKYRVDTAFRRTSVFLCLPIRICFMPNRYLHRWLSLVGTDSNRKVNLVDPSHLHARELQNCERLDKSALPQLKMAHIIPRSCFTVS